MKFLDEEHKSRYFEYIKKDNTNEKDNERKSMFYLLSLHPDLNNHINSIYNFKDHLIDFDWLEKGWVTSGYAAIIKLAFNLYNGYTGGVSTIDIFSCIDKKYIDYMLYAIKVRFGA